MDFLSSLTSEPSFRDKKAQFVCLFAGRQDRWKNRVEVAYPVIRIVAIRLAGVPVVTIRHSWILMMVVRNDIIILESCQTSPNAIIMPCLNHQGPKKTNNFQATLLSPPPGIIIATI